MKQLLWIPVLGTVAALVAIVLAHPEREDEPAPIPALDTPADPPPFDEPSIDEPDRQPPVDPPPAETVEPVLIELREDGSFGVVGEDETTFKDAAAVIEAYGATKPKPIIFLSNATKNVDRETLAKAADAMGGKLDVRLDFREGDG